MKGLHLEVLLAAGYAVFLLVVAVGIELLARHTHVRSQRFRTAGFAYHRHLDAWECPEGAHLHLHELDRERRLARYRAKPHICNGCPRKAACTDSDHGREVVRHLDPWPYSEAGRYHRGIALVPVALASLVCVVAAVRHHAAAELLFLATALTLTLFLAHHLLAAFRSSPANFPTAAGALPPSGSGQLDRYPEIRADPYDAVFPSSRGG